MNKDNYYGYKLCKIKKVKIITNTYNLALFENQLNNNSLTILPVKNLKEYKKLWKGCPFKDNLS